MAIQTSPVLSLLSFSKQKRNSNPLVPQRNKENTALNQSQKRGKQCFSGMLGTLQRGTTKSVAL
ncbi:hypothetical protein ACEQ6A_32790 [Rhizobium brockwellii]|uniref:hypothetical protein n=1 Tax=Rhizobium brockwellii TaxID=3019932 RepID=UPI003F96D4D4